MDDRNELINAVVVGWHRGEGNGEGCVFADSGRMAMGPRGTTLTPICQVFGFGEGDREQLETMIAATPDLIRALQKCYTEPTEGRYEQRIETINNIVMSALAKAFGNNDAYIMGRWIRVVFADPLYNFETKINGTAKDICDYYNKPLNVGVGFEDRMETPVAIEFLEPIYKRVEL